MDNENNNNLNNQNTVLNTQPIEGNNVQPTVNTTPVTDTEAPVTPEPTTTPNTEPPMPNTNKNSNILKIILIVLGVVICILLVMNLLNNKKDTSDTNENTSTNIVEDNNNNQQTDNSNTTTTTTTNQTTDNQLKDDTTPTGQKVATSVDGQTFTSNLGYSFKLNELQLGRDCNSSDATHSDSYVFDIDVLKIDSNIEKVQYTLFDSEHNMSSCSAYTSTWLTASCKTTLPKIVSSRELQVGKYYIKCLKTSTISGTVIESVNGIERLKAAITDKTGADDEVNITLN